jgi:hypothetical protein
MALQTFAEDYGVYFVAALYERPKILCSQQLQS